MTKQRTRQPSKRVKKRLAEKILIQKDQNTVQKKQKLRKKTSKKIDKSNKIVKKRKGSRRQNLKKGPSLVSKCVQKKAKTSIKLKRGKQKAVNTKKRGQKPSKKKQPKPKPKNKVVRPVAVKSTHKPKKPTLAEAEKRARVKKKLQEKKKIWKKLSVSTRMDWIQDMVNNNKLSLEDRVSCIGLLSFLLSNFFFSENKRSEFAEVCKKKYKTKLYNTLLDLMVDPSGKMIMGFIDDLVQEKENIIYQKQVKVNGNGNGHKIEVEENEEAAEKNE